MTISDFDHIPKEELEATLFKCCGSKAWVEKMIAILPVEDLIDLLEYAEEKWYECSQEDWLEAFEHHPQIGNIESLKTADAGTSEWAKNEQSKVDEASVGIMHHLAVANKLYKEKFGYIFIIKATGKSAEEMLAALQLRLQNSPEAEIEIAMEEQYKITRLRLEKLLLA